MREIIQVQAGRCGNTLGATFWEAIAAEHGLDPTGSSLSVCPQAFFSESAAGVYHPRAVLFELGSSTIETVRAQRYGHLFPPEICVSGRQATNCNWSKGHYTDGADMAPQVMEAVRRQAEECDSLQGFLFYHSIASGTGGGMGSLILSRLKEEYSKNAAITVSVFPSQKVSDTVLEPYSAILTCRYLLEYADAMVLLDNEALHSLCFRRLKLPTPSYADLNSIAVTALSGATCSLRSESAGVNSTLWRLAMNLAPFPIIKFLSVSVAPIISRGGLLCYPPGPQQLWQQMFDSANFTCGCELRHGRFLSFTAVLRGFLNAEVNELLSGNPSSPCFVDWIPDNIKCVQSRLSALGVKKSVVGIGNHTATQEVLRRVQLQFAAMFRRRAFLRNFSSEGADELDMEEAEHQVLEAISLYQAYEDSTSQGEVYD